MVFRWLYTHILLSLLLTACNVQPSSLPTETMPAPPTLTPERISPTETPVPTPAPPLCVFPRDGVVLQANSYEDFPLAIRDYLAMGGTFEGLDRELYAAGIANQPIAVSSGDLTGNERYDVVVSIFNPESTTLPPEGQLLIYLCEDGDYELAYQLASSEDWGAPIIRYLQDLNADGVSELVITSGMCGAHTCFEEVQVLAWDGGNFINKLEGDASDLPFPDVLVTDRDGNGIFDIEVTGSGFGSIGAGPPRNVIRIWTYDPGEKRWLTAEEILQPSNYRIHVLHDADKAAEEVDFYQALMLYSKVIQDDTLEDWQHPEGERAMLAAYAHFKSIAIYMNEGNLRLAEAMLDQMRENTPPGTPAYSYLALAELFVEAYAEGGISGGCIVARRYAEEHAEQVLTPLGPENFGYGNPGFTPHDVCPW